LEAQQLLILITLVPRPLPAGANGNIVDTQKSSRHFAAHHRRCFSLDRSSEKSDEMVLVLHWIFMARQAI
jgi:hypothetical protein